MKAVADRRIRHDHVEVLGAIRKNRFNSAYDSKRSWRRTHHFDRGAREKAEIKRRLGFMPLRLERAAEIDLKGTSECMQLKGVRPSKLHLGVGGATMMAQSS